MGPLPQGTDEPLSHSPRAAPRDRARIDSDALCSLILERPTDFFRRAIEFCSFRRPAVAASSPDPESVPAESRQHVEVHVEDLLAGRLPVREPQVHRLARQSAAPERRGDLPGGFQDGSRAVLRKVFEVCGMGLWNHKGVARDHRADVQECERSLVLVDDARGCLSLDDPAEDAVRDRDGQGARPHVFVVGPGVWSAIISRTSWKSPIGRPKAFRSFTYFTAASNAARATPTAPAAIPMRPLFSVFMAWAQPSPRFPIRFSFGIRQCSKARSAVGLARNPSFVVVSTWVTLNPGASFGTMNKEIPSCRLVPGSRA